MKQKWYERKWVIVGAIGLLVPAFAGAQFFSMGPTFTIDLAAEAHLAKEVLIWGKKLAADAELYQSVRNQEMMLRNNMAYLTNKSQFRTGAMLLLNSTLGSPVNNLYGETAGMTNALTLGGKYALPAWANAAVKVDTSPWANGMIPGAPQLASLASQEMMQAAGTNNVATVGNARNYLNQSQTARTSWENTVHDPGAADNTQAAQLNLLTTGTAQTLDLSAMNLQVNASMLQTMSGVAKEFSDAHAEDLNLQAREYQYQRTEATGMGGMATAFASR